MAILDLEGHIGPRQPAPFEGYSRGEWEFMPGDNGDPDVGIGPTAPNIFTVVDTPNGEDGAWPYPAIGGECLRSACDARPRPRSREREGSELVT